MPEQVLQAPSQRPAAITGLMTQAQAAIAETLPNVASPEELATMKKDLGLLGPEELKTQAAKKVDPALNKQAEDFVGKLLAIDFTDPTKQEGATLSIENLGENVARQSFSASQLIEQPIKRLGMIGGGEGQQIADTMVNLKVQFDEIDPTRVNFSPGWKGRIAGYIPWVGTPMNRYFTKFESSGKIIQSLFDSIEVSKGELLRDINSLRADQTTMRVATKNLQNLITTAMLIDEKLKLHLGKLDPADEAAKFINTELIFPLLQRITDLQQQLVVNQQGVLMFEVLIKNNKELIRGIKRCKNVTYPALMIGIIAAQALANQQIALNKINALDEVADKMVNFNSKLLGTTAIEINKKAASAQLSDIGLAQAVKDAIKALDDVDNFRLKAIEQMGIAIRERAGLTELAEGAIQKMERGRQASVKLNIDDEVVAAAK